jgi:transposase-like protein
MRTSQKARPQREVWRNLIRQQESSGLSVRAFCRENVVHEHSFYLWRKRLAEENPPRFALVETNGAAPENATLELVFARGERLRIGSGVEPATLRAVLAVLRERA